MPLLILSRAMLTKDPAQRPTIDEILDKPFIRKRWNDMIQNKTMTIRANAKKLGKRLNSADGKRKSLLPGSSPIQTLRYPTRVFIFFNTGANHHLGKERKRG